VTLKVGLIIWATEINGANPAVLTIFGLVQAIVFFRALYGQIAVDMHLEKKVSIGQKEQV
jgi:hypothetical protein